MTNSNDIFYPLIFLVCYIATLGFFGYVVYLIFKYLENRSTPEPEKLTEETNVNDK